MKTLLTIILVTMLGHALAESPKLSVKDVTGKVTIDDEWLKEKRRVLFIFSRANYSGGVDGQRELEEISDRLRGLMLNIPFVFVIDSSNIEASQQEYVTTEAVAAYEKYATPLYVQLRVLHKRRFPDAPMLEKESALSHFLFVNDAKGDLSTELGVGRWDGDYYVGLYTWHPKHGGAKIYQIFQPGQ